MLKDSSIIGSNKNIFFKSLADSPWFSALASLLVLCLVILFVNRNFFMVGNMLDILRTSSFAFMVAAPVTVLMIAGDLDLAIGAYVSLGGIICAKALIAGIPIFWAILITLVAGALVGFIKSVIVVQIGLPSFIITLALQFVISGFILVWTKGMAVSSLPAAFTVLGQGSLFGRVYNSLLMALLIGIAFYILLTKTKFGRSVFAIGGNPQTAYLSGINVNRSKYIAHILVPVFAAFTGVVYASRFASAITNIGTGSELIIIAAVIIGGTSIFGGSGSIFGTAIGGILFAAIANGLILIGVSVYWQNLVFGVILIISIVIDKYRMRIGGI